MIFGSMINLQKNLLLKFVGWTIAVTWWQMPSCFNMTVGNLFFETFVFVHGWQLRPGRQHWTQGDLLDGHDWVRRSYNKISTIFMIIKTHRRGKIESLLTLKPTWLATLFVSFHFTRVLNARQLVKLNVKLGTNQWMIWRVQRKRIARAVRPNLRTVRRLDFQKCVR